MKYVFERDVYFKNDKDNISQHSQNQIPVQNNTILNITVPDFPSASWLGPATVMALSQSLVITAGRRDHTSWARRESWASLGLLRSSWDRWFTTRSRGEEEVVLVLEGVDVVVGAPV